MSQLRRGQPSTAELEWHVRDLCSKERIAIEWCSQLKAASGCRASRRISTHRVKSVVIYAIALREIGHILGRHQNSNSAQVRQRWAWEWARANALVWTPRMEETAMRCLQDCCSE